MKNNYLVMPITFGTPAYDEAVALRYEILRRPLALTFSVEQLEKEYEDLHLGCYAQHSGQLVGCLVLQNIDEKTLKMRQVAVDTAAQNQGIGKQLVAAAEAHAKAKDCSNMVLHARETAVDFYLKLGYQIEGTRFEEVGIPHFKMSKKINT